MLSILIVTWLLGIVLFGGLQVLAIHKLGGWQGYLNARVALGGNKKHSSERVQWSIVLVTVLWPLAIALTIFQLRKGLDKS